MKVEKRIYSSGDPRNDSDNPIETIKVRDVMKTGKEIDHAKQ